MDLNSIKVYFCEHWFYSACFALVLLFLILIQSIIRRKTKAILVSKTTTGKVEISRSAFFSLINNICRGAGIQNQVRLHVFQDRKDSLNLKLYIKVNANQKVNTLIDGLKQTVLDTLRENFGIQNVRNIHIVVTHIQGILAIAHSSTLPSIKNFESKSNDSFSNLKPKEAKKDLGFKESENTEELPPSSEKSIELSDKKL